MIFHHACSDLQEFGHCCELVMPKFWCELFPVISICRFNAFFFELLHYTDFYSKKQNNTLILVGGGGKGGGETFTVFWLWIFVDTCSSSVSQCVRVFVCVIYYM